MTSNGPVEGLCWESLAFVALPAENIWGEATSHLLMGKLILASVYDASVISKWEKLITFKHILMQTKNQLRKQIYARLERLQICKISCELTPWIQKNTLLKWFSLSFSQSSQTFPTFMGNTSADTKKYFHNYSSHTAFTATAALWNPWQPPFHDVKRAVSGSFYPECVCVRKCMCRIFSVILARRHSWLAYESLQVFCAVKGQVSLSITWHIIATYL